MVMDAYRAGLPVAVEIAPGNRRLVAGLVEQGGVVLFADIGWSFSVGHPFHRLPAGARLVEVEHGDPLAGEWNAWLQSDEPDRRGRAEELLRDMHAQNML